MIQDPQSWDHIAFAGVYKALIIQQFEKHTFILNLDLFSGS